MRMSHRAPRKPPLVNQNRAAIQGDDTWLYPDRQYATHLEVPGPAICERCHSYLETDHWLYDEQRYRELKVQSGIHVTLCPGCVRVERRLYEGEVTIRHQWDKVDKGDVMHLIHNEEARARVTNPSARVAILEDHGDELYVLTTTQFLAKRIGRQLYKAYRGALTVTPLLHERFTRVCWARE
ncbi:MAG: hypothetical protein ACYDBB_14970 [Armatimonadota bacterium]